jgi:hypothetical protein
MRALIGTEAVAPLLPDLGRWAALATAAHRISVAQAVLDELVTNPGADPDPMVVTLACAELHAAEAGYLRLRDALRP